MLEYKTASSSQQEVSVRFSLGRSHLGSGVTGIDKLPSLKVEMAKTFPSVQVFFCGILAELSRSVYITF